MEKLCFFVQRAAGLSREEFQRRYLEEHVPLVLRRFPRLRGLAANVVVSREDPAQTDALLRADAITSMWFDSYDDFADLALRYGTAEGREAVERDWAALATNAHGYRVVERVQLDYERDWPSGQLSPGRKMIAPLRRRNGLSFEQFEEHWLQTHAPLALKHVLGIWRYVTNVVSAPLFPGAPDIDGVVEVHYKEKRAFDSPEGERIIREDTASFLQPPVSLNVTEYVFLP